MKSFFGICVLSALVAVGTTHPTHNSPHHDVEQTQHHMQPEHMSRPEHHMSQREHHMNQPEHHMSQPEHHMSQPEHHMRQQEHHMSQSEHHMSEPEHYPSQPKHHIITQTEHHISQPSHYMSQPQHDYESWSNAEAQAHAQSQRPWISPEQSPYQPVEILSQPIIHAQPHIIHSQPLPIDPQFELHPYPYQHPHYPPIESHHTQDSLLYPTHGWNMKNPAAYQHPLPEEPAPEQHLNSFKEDYPNQSSAFANAVASTNSIPVSSHEPAKPQLYKIISIPKADDGADYIMPVADHETRPPRVIHTSNDEGLPDIVKEILAKYRHIPIKIKPEQKPNNAPSPKERKPEGDGLVHRPHKQKKHKVPTIPVVSKQSAKTKAVAVAKTDTDKTYTIITGGKHRAATKAPLKHIHKHSHKKVLKPLLDPELQAKEVRLVSKELWVPLPDKTHENDIPCDDSPIVTDDCTNPDDADCDDGSKSIDKNKPTNKHQEKHSDPHIISAETTPEKDKPEKTTTTSTYVELDDEKDADKDTDYDSASLDETTEPCDDDNAPEKEDKRKNHEPKPIINKKQNINPKPVPDPNIENNDLKEKEFLQEKEIKKELIKKVEAKKETIEQSPKYVTQLRKYDGKLNSKIDQKDADKDNDWFSPSPDETTEHCVDDNVPNKENEGKKHVLIPKTDEKPNHDSDKNKPKSTFPHHHHKHSHPHTPINIVPEKDTTKTTTPILTVKPADQKDRDNDCDSTNSDKTAEPRDTENAPEKEDKTKKRPKPKTGKKNTDSKPVDNKGNTDTITDHKIVQNKELKKEVTRKVEAKKEKTEQSPKYVPQIKKYNEKQNSKQDQKDAGKDNNWVSPSPDKTTEPCDDDDNEPKQENERKKHVLIPKTDAEPNHDSDKNIRTITFPHHHDKHSHPHTPTNIVPEKDIAKTTTPSSNVKPGDQKDEDRDNDCDSANFDEITEPCDSENAQKKEDKTKKYLPKPKTGKKNNDSKLLDSKGNTYTITDHKIVQKQEVKKEVTRKVKTKKDKTVQIKQQPEIYDENQKPVEQDYNTAVIDECDSTEGSVPHLQDDKTPASEYTDKREQSVAHTKKDNKKQQPLNTNKGNKDISDKNKPKDKLTQHQNKNSNTYFPTNTASEKKIAKLTTPSTYIKSYDKKDQGNADKDNGCASVNSDEITEPCDTENTLIKEDNLKKQPPKPKKDDKKYADTKLVDNNKGNINSKPDHTGVQKKEVKQEVTRKVEMKKEETVLQSKKTKQQPEPHNDKQKLVEQDYSTPVSEECDSTESSLNRVPYDKIPAPEHKEKIKKPLPQAIKDDNKPVSSDTDKGDKKNIIAKKDFRKVEQTKEVTRKVETKKTNKNLPEHKNYKDKLKPEKQENQSSDIENCDSTESSECQRPFDKIPAPEYKRELKEPLLKGNKDGKDLTKAKKIADEKEETVKVETKTKKSMKNVVSSEAVDKSKPAETSNENSDIDDSDSADSETDPKQDKTKTIKEKNDAKKNKTKEIIKKKATIANNKDEATDKELSSDEVAEILEKTETDQPLSTVGFLFSFISHALQVSLKQIFEEPKVKTFVKGIMPLVDEKPNEGIV